jgi:hypothetical protein
VKIGQETYLLPAQSESLSCESGNGRCDRNSMIFQNYRESGSTSDEDKDPDPQEIIRRFSANESENSQARETYTYRQILKIVELSPSGNPQGQYELVQDFIFTPDGRRSSRVVDQPPSTLRRLLLTPEDEQDLSSVQSFFLTTDQIPHYNVTYLGRQKLNDVGCFAFSVKPRKLEKSKRYFEGQIWVDDGGLQIVKTYGKGVGIVPKGNEFPRFETYREQIDGKYWFPTKSQADDVLHFPKYDQRVSVTVEYQDYKQLTR